VAEDRNSKKIKEYEELFTRAVAGRERDDIFKYKKNCEEFYFNDVESTLSQLTKKQQNTIRKTFNIPISTKITYPIIEQIISFLTGLKPFPRLIAAEKSMQPYTEAYQRAYHAIWYESHSDREVSFAIRDMLTTGSGFLQLRTSDFYTESTFNVIQKYVPWKNVLLDPDTREPDLKDCGYAVIYYKMRAKKAEKKYDISIDESDIFTIGSTNMVNPQADEDVFMDNWDLSLDKKNKYVDVREFYQLDMINVYISENGDITTKRPKPIDVPNPRKEELLQSIDLIKSSMEKLLKMSTENKRKANINDEQSMTDAQTIDQQISQQLEQSAYDIKKLTKEYNQEPEEVPAFEIITESGEAKIVYDISKDTKKRVKQTLMIGQKIIYERFIRIDRIPIVHFNIMMKGNINRTYGLVHFFKDIVAAMNKMWALILLDMMTHGNRKIIVPEGAFQDLRKTEDTYAQPGAAFITYNPNPGLPNGGKPEELPPAPFNQSIAYILQQFIVLIEYITGINSVVQGNPQNAPETFGATQSLQLFGTQRVKLYSRSLESTFEDLALLTVQFIQAYTPMDKVIRYLDENGDEQEVELLKDTEDTQFKVRVIISQSLPTIRLSFAKMLSDLAGQTKNPYVADALTKVSLDLMDMPEGKKLSEDIDVIKQLEQQLQQVQEELKTKDQNIKLLEHNMYQQKLASSIDKDTQEAKANIKLAENDAINKIDNNTENSQEPQILEL